MPHVYWNSVKATTHKTPREALWSRLKLHSRLPLSLSFLLVTLTLLLVRLLILRLIRLLLVRLLILRLIPLLLILRLICLLRMLMMLILILRQIHYLGCTRLWCTRLWRRLLHSIIRNKPLPTSTRSMRREMCDPFGPCTTGSRLPP